jgi:hypothetical protein
MVAPQANGQPAAAELGLPADVEFSRSGLFFPRN